MSTETIELLGKIFELCIIPLLGVLVPFIIQWIRTKSAALVANADNDLSKK